MQAEMESDANNTQHDAPLSKRIAVLLENSGQQEITLNFLLERTEGRGVFPLIILLCIPFIAPVSVPGMSTPLGLAMILMMLASFRGQKARFPKRIGDRRLPPKAIKIIQSGGLKFLRFIEKVVRPRRTGWMSWRAARICNGLVLIWMAFLLALPIPPLLPPMTNAFPSYAIILLAASMMEGDGLMIWAGYAASLATTIYFIVCGDYIIGRMALWISELGRMLHLST